MSKIVIPNQIFILDQMYVLTSSYEKKDGLFVETKAYRELKTIVEDDYWATILGKPGDGISATGMHLLLHYRKKGYQPLIVSSVRQWESMVSHRPGEKQFVLIDNIFGWIYLDNKKVREWLPEFEKMEIIVAERQGDILVVCTSRKHIFTDVGSNLWKCSLIRSSTIVDMTDKEYKLSSDEKSDILRKYANRFTIKIDETMVNQIKVIDSPHGFPHCVEQFCKNVFLRKRGISYFDNPEELLQKELRNIRDNDSMKFLVLLLVLLKENRLHQGHFVEMIDHPDEEEQKLFKFTGISLSTAYAGIMKAVDALTNTYLKQTTDGYYTFTHESLSQNVSKVYRERTTFRATHLNTPIVKPFPTLNCAGFSEDNPLANNSRGIIQSSDESKLPSKDVKYDGTTELTLGLLRPFGSSPVHTDESKTLSDPQTYHKSLVMGCQIATSYLTCGTLGAFVQLRNGGIGCLTCSHVFETPDSVSDYRKDPMSSSFFKTEVYQPNPSNDYKFGHVATIIKDPGDENIIGVDAALIEITSPQRYPKNGDFPSLNCAIAGFSEESTPVFNSGEIIKSFDEINFPCPVVKFGATTGLTMGVLRSFGSAVQVGKFSLPGDNIQLHQQLEVLSEGQMFAKEGDSGSLVFCTFRNGESTELKALGLLVGGTANGNGIVTPIWAILDKLQLPLQLFCFDDSHKKNNESTLESSNFQMLKADVDDLKTGLSNVNSRLDVMSSSMAKKKDIDKILHYLGLDANK